MAKTATKTRVTKKQVIAHRTRAVKDTSPTWEGCEAWTADEFHRHFKRAMDYYRLESDIKSYKPVVVKWMEANDYSKRDVAAFKKIKDSRISTTMGAVTACLNRGMTPHRIDFNSGRDTAAWLRTEIVKVLAEGKDDVDPAEAAAEKEAAKKDVYTPSIQERVREAAYRMTEELEEAIESLEKAIEMEPTFQEAIIELARVKDLKPQQTNPIDQL
jgi:tetratricopeptide (TPR) repeat protein